MSIEVAAIVLLAAALHAGWNTLIKVRGDRLIVMAVVTLAGSMISLPFLLFVESPQPAVWPLLALTILLHTGYHLFLPLAYNHGDLGQVYPIARGIAPVLVALGAFVVAGETLGSLSLAGILCLAVGVISLTFDRNTGLGINPKAVLYALMTGVFIASYTVVDGIGVRESGSIMGFAVWLTIGDGLMTAFLVYCWKGNELWRVLRQNLGTASLGGTMQVGAYWIIIWALALAPMAMVSALRETSVLFAALISTFLLKEGFGAWRFVSAGLVTLGLILSRADK